MLSTPKWWFDQIVFPNYGDFMGAPMSQRRAFNAFVTTYHMYDRLYWYYTETDSPHLGGMSKDQFREHLKSKCAALEEIGMAANSAKHSLRVRPGKPPVFEPQFSATGHTVVSVAGSESTLLLASGREVREQLTKVIDFWKGWLLDHPDPEPT